MVRSCPDHRDVYEQISAASTDTGNVALQPCYKQHVSPDVQSQLRLYRTGLTSADDLIDVKAIGPARMVIVEFIEHDMYHPTVKGGVAQKRRLPNIPEFPLPIFWGRINQVDLFGRGQPDGLHWTIRPRTKHKLARKASARQGLGHTCLQSSVEVDCGVRGVVGTRGNRGTVESSDRLVGNSVLWA